MKNKIFNDYKVVSKGDSNYPEKLDLSMIPKDEKNSSKIFDLVGVVKRKDIGNKEHYISLIMNPNDQNWYLYDNEDSQKHRVRSCMWRIFRFCQLPLIAGHTGPTHRQKKLNLET